MVKRALQGSDDPGRFAAALQYFVIARRPGAIIPPK